MKERNPLNDLKKKLLQTKYERILYPAIVVKNKKLNQKLRNVLPHQKTEFEFFDRHKQKSLLIDHLVVFKIIFIFKVIVSFLHNLLLYIYMQV